MDSETVKINHNDYNGNNNKENDNADDAQNNKQTNGYNSRT